MRAWICRLSLAATVCALSPAGAFAAGYGIRSADPLSPYFVSGGQVQVVISGLASARFAAASLRLNGTPTKARLTAAAGEARATVAGLREGDNRIDLLIEGSKAPVAHLTMTRGISPRVGCAELAGMTIAADQIGLPTRGARVDTANLRPAVERPGAPADSVPEFCDVKGSILPVDMTAPDIKFGVAIPTSWNQKAIQIGGNGRNGFIPYLSALARPGAGSPMGPLYPPNRSYPRRRAM
jgi:hypothetical protein